MLRKTKPVIVHSSGESELLHGDPDRELPGFWEQLADRNAARQGVVLPKLLAAGWSIASVTSFNETARVLVVLQQVQATERPGT